MINQVNNTDFEASQKRLSEIMDMEAWGRFSAYESLTNTYHFDNVHNWRIYYDPWRQKLVPIAWDTTGWLPNWRVAESRGKAIAPQSVSSLHAKLFQNGDFIRARNAALVDFFEKGLDKDFIEFSQQTIETLFRESKHDPYLRPASEDKVRTEAKKLVAYIERVMREGVDYTSPPTTGVSFGNIDSGIRLSVDGKSIVKRVRIIFDKPLGNKPYIEAVMSKLVANKSVSEQRVNLAETAILSGAELILDTEFLPGSTLSGPGLLPRQRALTLLYKRGDYDLLFGDAMLGEAVNTPKSVWVDMGQGWQKISEIATTERASFENLYNPIKTPIIKTPLIWDGTKVISGVMELDSPLIIKAGTSVILREDASLIMRNKLDVQGTPDAPVRFIREDGQSAPWGTIAILGKTANQSRLNHCVMDGGSGYKEKLFEYSGMLSVHDVQGMKIDNCTFKNGTVVDDMVHVVYSSVDFSDSLFDTSFSDALDIDISDARLKNVNFINSGNDAVDLMSSTVSIVNSHLSDSGDKGISVGEGSRLLGVNNVIMNNGIGVQVKDGSKAFLYNQTIEKNVQGIDAYKKNWRYNGGGEAYVHKTVLAKNESTVSSDKNSQITVFDSFVDGKVKKKKRIQLLASDEESRKVAVENESLLPEDMNFTTENLSILESFDTDVMNMRDASRSGAK